MINSESTPKLNGRIALVTGGGSGIGRATAELFGLEGATVIVADWNKAAGERTVEDILKGGGGAAFYHADVSNAADVRSLISSTTERFGGLDILVNNAAVQIMGTLTETSEEDWDRIHSVNLKGVFLGCKYAIPVMLGRGKGAIVNVSSVLGFVGDPDLAAYCAAKGGVIALTRAASLSYGPKGIRINCVCPGDVDTQLVQDYFDSNPDPKAFRQEIYAKYALRRIASPLEVAKSIAFLASDESSFITGSALIVDGGLTVKCY